MKPKKPIVLAILDGWGYRESAPDNALSCATTPVFKSLFTHYPYSLLEASQHFVGLPTAQMGNSEVGHMTIGAGRIIMQELPRIDQAIEQNTLVRQPVLATFIHTLKEKGGTCHIVGLLSDGGVHSHHLHIIALAKLMQHQGIPVRLHAFLDGRDTPPRSAQTFVKDVKQHVPEIPFGTVGGRYYGMDRDQRWERVEKAYVAMVQGKGPQAPDAETVIDRAYAQGITDEFIEPTVIAGYNGMNPGDGLLMANFRADRARQLATALLDPEFTGFTRHVMPDFSVTASLTEYSSALVRFLPVVFEKEKHTQGLGEILAAHHLKQLRIAETEKYAHVTFFFNGGREEPFEGEERILIPSPKVATYDLQPEMSAFMLTDQLVEHLKNVDVVVVNYANLDMVGHSGNQQAVQKAVEALDICIGRLMKAVIDLDGVLLLTADHGNAEQMWDDISQSPHTAHTCNPVPFVGVNLPADIKELNAGQLCDIAPTILELLGIIPPVFMTGKSLLK